MNKVELSVCEHKEQWDTFVRKSSEGTIFHESIWIDDAKFLLASHKGDVLIALPIVSNPHAGTLPHNIPYSGPIHIPSEMKPVNSLATRDAQKLLAKYVASKFPEIVFCTSPWGNTFDSWLTTGFELTLIYTRVIPLIDLDDTFNGFSPTLRSNIRAAAHKGIIVEREPAIDALRALVLSTFEKQNRVPWFDLSRVVKKIDVLAGMNLGGAFIARDVDGNALAGAGVVWDHKRAYYVLGGRNSLYSHRTAMSFVLWSAMQFVHNTIGLFEFDMEGSERPGISTFFEQFRGEVRAYYRVSYRGRSIWD